MTTRKVEVRSRAHALEQVAGYTVGDLEAYIENTYGDEAWDAMTPAEQERISWAVEELQRAVIKVAARATKRQDRNRSRS